jgi:hypothetical protein
MRRETPRRPSMVYQTLVMVCRFATAIAVAARITRDNDQVGVGAVLETGHEGFLRSFNYLSRRPRRTRSLSPPRPFGRTNAPPRKVWLRGRAR